MDNFIFWKITFSDIISFIGLCFTIWIAIVVQRGFTQSRYIREYFINELKIIGEDYKCLFNSLYSSEIGAAELKNKLKLISMHILSIENFIKSYYKIEYLEMYSIHSDFQQFITSGEDFNEQYKSTVIKFSVNTRYEIEKLQKKIVCAITTIIITVNSAHENNRFKRKRQISNFSSMK